MDVRIRVAAGVGAAFALVTVLVAVGPAWLSTGVDGAVSRAVVAGIGPHAGLRTTLAVLTWAGQPLVVDAVVLVAAVVLHRRGRTPVAAALVLTGLLSLLVRAGVKTALDRARPTPTFAEATGGSFPSGHTAGAAFVAVAAVLLVRRVWVAVAGALYAVGVGVTRVLLDVHWVSDVVAGLLLGAAFALLVPGVAARIGQGASARRGRTLPDRPGRR